MYKYVGGGRVGVCVMCLFVWCVFCVWCGWVCFFNTEFLIHAFISIYQGLRMEVPRIVPQTLEMKRASFLIAASGEFWMKEGLDGVNANT